MGLLNKLPGYEPAQPGMERRVLKECPKALAIGVAVLISPSLVLRLGGWGLHPVAHEALISKADIFAYAGLWAFFNLVVWVALTAFIVVLMKGPAYVADPYPLIDADHPAPLTEERPDYAQERPE